MNELGKKLILFVFLYLIYQNILYIILAPEIYSIPIFVVYLITAYMITLVDTLIRSIPEAKKAPKIFNFLILLLLLLAPFFLISAFFENKFFISQLISFWDNIGVSYIGFCLYLAGGLFTLVARSQLGRFGTAELITEEEHELVTNGVYRFIRNPMYAGALVATIGFCLIFRSIITLVIMFISNFFVFRFRIIEEERVLIEKFGEKFEDYKKKTKKLIPFVY
ncbi:MAG: methyltransferase family protein [Promethearchaeota archaeon]